MDVDLMGRKLKMLLCEAKSFGRAAAKADLLNHPQVFPETANFDLDGLEARAFSDGWIAEWAGSESFRNQNQSVFEALFC